METSLANPLFLSLSGFRKKDQKEKIMCYNLSWRIYSHPQFGDKKGNVELSEADKESIEEKTRAISGN
jgi:hypothetical protein